MNVREGRYAAIDIGTVTCRMLVADVRNSDGSLSINPLVKEYAVTNLGEGVDATRRLSEAALARVMAAVDGFLEVRSSLDVAENPVLETLVMATSASRDAENAGEFAALLAKRGLKLAVIPGTIEASLSFMGASSSYAGESVAVVDIGGGSTEISLGVGGAEPRRSRSFDIGCRRMTERFWDGYPPSETAVSEAREWVRPQFEEWLTAGDGALPSRLIAVAGTATSVVSIREEMQEYDPERVNGAEVTLAQLEGIERSLASMSAGELEHVVGLDPRRGPVIVAGLVILEEVMRAFGVDVYTASESDILEGMVMYMARRQTGCK